MGNERDDRRYGRDQSYGYRPEGRSRDYERGYGRGEDMSYSRDRGHNRGGYQPEQTDYRRQSSDYGRAPQGYDYDERGFLDRAGDEVRSWFGDEEAERRRRWDERNAQREYERNYGGGRDMSGRGTSGRYLAYGDPGFGLPAGYGSSSRGEEQPNRGHDPNYRSWRDRQMEAFDREYEDYRREHQSRFDQDFSGWRRNREMQRQSLGQVREHQEVVGSDGEHLGTVDKVKGDRIVLTKSDQDAGGHHHSIPSSWINRVGDKIEISRTAEQARQAWKDEERSGFFGDEDDRPDGPHILNRSFSGTY